MSSYGLSFCDNRTSTSLSFFVLLFILLGNSFHRSTALDTSQSMPRRSGLLRASASASEDAIHDAKELLMSLGVPPENLCRRSSIKSVKGLNVQEDISRTLPLCTPILDAEGVVPYEDFRFEKDDNLLWSRFLEDEEEVSLGEEDPWFVTIMALCAFACVLTAALAAGLTMGMLSLDPLMLLVKIRASRSDVEKQQAESLLPIVRQHHMLLVTLLLLNSMANEALPLFLEVLVPPFVSVLLSVTFVLIFGEILPSAIFTGPKKLELASRMVPLVKFVMVLVWPVAYPIAKVLDKFLHGEEEEEGAFGRGEISALVRIQYEERIANKRQRKLERMETAVSKSNTKPGFPHPKPRQHDVEVAIKSIKAESTRNLSKRQSSIENLSALTDVESIHVDEVMMVEGALQMKTKTALEAFTPIHRMFGVPENLILDENTVVDIFSSGYSRIPVYEPNPSKPKSQASIKGILITKHLIVVNMNEDRPLITMPLMIPPCVSPTMNLVELVNLFQTGRYGHFALVCARPQLGTDALKNGNAVPEKAGLMGIITLEDVLEELLQEEIFDENDQMEKEAERIALWVGKKWRRSKRKRELAAEGKPTSFGSVVDAVQAKMASEATALLEKDEDEQQTGSFLGSILTNLGLN